MKWSDIIKPLLRESSVPKWLTGKMYHGTARRNLAFHPNRVAYFIHKEEYARKLAIMDAEVDGGIPKVIEVTLDIRNPAILDTMLMQDLHLPEHQELVRKLITEGYDCAIGEYPGEVCVLDPRHIHVTRIINVLNEAVMLRENLSPDTLATFRYGGCIFFAMALHDLMGWPVYAKVEWYNKRTREDGGIEHAWAANPKGQAVDIDGVHNSSKPRQGRGPTIELSDDRLWNYRESEHYDEFYRLAKQIIKQHPERFGIGQSMLGEASDNWPATMSAQE